MSVWLSPRTFSSLVFSTFNYWTRSHSKELTDWPVTSKADFPQVLMRVISSERFTLTATQTSPKTAASHICVGRILPSFCICCELVLLSTKCKIYAMKKKVCDETFLCIDQNISKEKQKSKRALRTRLNLSRTRIIHFNDILFCVLSVHLLWLTQAQSERFFELSTACCSLMLMIKTTAAHHESHAAVWSYTPPKMGSQILTSGFIELLRRSYQNQPQR